MAQLLSENKLITTQCQTCSTKFSIHENDLDAHGNTRCSNCGANIKIAICPSCKTSYSIVTDRLKPMSYTTRCKKCHTQFTIDITSADERPLSDVKKTTTMPSRPSLFTPPPVKAPAPVKPSVFTASPGKTYTQSDLFGKKNSQAELQKDSGKQTSFTDRQTGTDTGLMKNTKTGSTHDSVTQGHNSYPPEQRPQSPVEARKDPDSGYLSGSVKSYFDKKQSERYTLKGIFSLYAMAFHPARIFMGAAGVVVTAGAIFLWSLLKALPAGLIPPQVGSYLIYVPLALIYTGYVTSAAAITRSVLNSNAREPLLGKTARSSASAFFTSLITGCISILALNAALVFLTRIPQAGTVVFALILLPVYVSSLGFAFLIFAGVWLLPFIHAKHNAGLSSAYRELFGTIRHFGGRLLYYIPLMCVSMTLISSMILFIHNFAFRMTEYAALAVSGDTAARTVSLVPVSLQKFITIVTSGGNGELAGLVSGNITIADSSAGIITGLVLAAIAIFLYGTLISVCATVSAQTLSIMQTDSGVPESVRRKGLWSALLLALVLAVIRFFLLK